MRSGCGNGEMRSLKSQSEVVFREGVVIGRGAHDCWYPVVARPCPVRIVKIAIFRRLHMGRELVVM